MHEMELGKTDSSPDQSAAPGTKRKMIALNALCILLSGYDSTFTNTFLIRTIAVRIDRVDMERCQQRSQFVQIFVLTRTKTICQRHTSVMINGPP